MSPAHVGSHFRMVRLRACGFRYYSNRIKVIWKTCGWLTLRDRCWKNYRWRRGQLSNQNFTASKPSLALIILAVSDLERSLGFYRRVFDWPEIVNTPSYVEFQLPNGLRLGLYFRDGFARNVGQTPLLVPEGELTSTEIYFQTADLAGFVARLEQSGARTLSPLTLREWGDEAAYFADPDGNVIVAARPASI